MLRRMRICVSQNKPESFARGASCLVMICRLTWFLQSSSLELCRRMVRSVTESKRGSRRYLDVTLLEK